jgi:predicted anti-sigma-YlaC factor YlaD
MNMPDQMHHKLGAYLDGELDRRSQIEVQAHLETCLTCQHELEELRRLSNLLRAAPLPDFTPVLTFRSQLMLQLPRRTEKPQLHSNGWFLPWLVPALVLAGWIFIQVTLGLSTLFLLASQAGFLDGAAAWVTDAPQQMQWFIAAQATIGSLLNPAGQTGLLVLNDAGLFAQNLVILLLWQVGVAILYWGALALLWHTQVKASWTSPVSG